MRVIRSVLLGTHRDLDTISGCTERRGVALVDDNTIISAPSCSVAAVSDATDRTTLKSFSEPIQFHVINSTTYLVASASVLMRSACTLLVMVLPVM